ncbi:hypothetical protein GH5_00178 [Leishmania sp. Ghana 2012 LV757]|uniref:hypothetical protein n=1 Tax=Leishmania sp. Ghana 2012 LV757 TaxID=2803181 RepID=UPI001B674AF3|nr:hypothetical protein GH5_00178 [Leishmania sp. Ghana 2012 LV757]
MPSDSDLSFHIPSAGLRRLDPWNAANASNFTHLHLVSNPDWTSSFCANQQVAAASPALVPPIPVAIELSAPRPLRAPASIDVPASAARKSFLSMFYHSSSSTVPLRAIAQHASVSASSPTSAPPKALGIFDTPPQRALPVDAQLPVEHLSKLGKLDATISAAPRREPPRPMALSSDTWNALNGVPLPSKTAGISARLLVPPASIDAVSSRAPKPLWSDLSFTSRFRSTAPTLEAFRNAPPAPMFSTPSGIAPQQVNASAATVATAPIPVPPKPVTTSPMRNRAERKVEAAGAAAAPATHHKSRVITCPLVPVGEAAPAAITPLLNVQEALVMPTASASPSLSTMNATSPVWELEPLNLASSEPEQMLPSAHAEEPASPLTTEFAKSISRPTMQHAQRDEARAAANVRNFISTLFRMEGENEADSSITGRDRADGFDALEIVKNCRGAQAKVSQPADYSTFFTSLVDDDCDEESEEGLEKLRRVLFMVMQSAKNQDGNNVLQPSGQSGRRSSSGDGTGAAAPTPFPSKYTEFSASYQTTSNNTNDSEWMQFARF